MSEAVENEKKYANIHEETHEKVVRATPGNYLFNMQEMDQFMIGPHYSSSIGSAVRGEKLQVVLVNKPKGTGSRLHTHANEQFNYVIKGKLKYRVRDVEGVAEAGQVLHIPAGAEHYCVTTGDEDCLYFASKDTTYFVAGDAVDGARSGAYYEEE